MKLDRLLEARLCLPDPDDWALVRAAELRARGEPARIRLRTEGTGARRTYHIAIVRADGSIEEP